MKKRITILCRVTSLVEITVEADSALEARRMVTRGLGECGDPSDVRITALSTFLKEGIVGREAGIAQIDEGKDA